MKTLLVISAGIEAAAGIALLAVPALIVQMLLGVRLDSPGGLAIGRLAGVALLTVGVACGGVSRDARSRAARGVVAAMLFYNVAVVVLLASLRFGAGMTGVGVWPAILLHSALAVWCIMCLRGRVDRPDTSRR